MFLAFGGCINAFNAISSNFNFYFHRLIKGFTILLLLFSCSKHPKCAGQHQAILGIDTLPWWCGENFCFKISGNLKTVLRVCNGLVSTCWAFSLFCAFIEPSVNQKSSDPKYLCTTDGIQSKKTVNRSDYCIICLTVLSALFKSKQKIILLEFM